MSSPNCGFFTYYIYTNLSPSALILMDLSGRILRTIIFDLTFN